MVGTERQTIDPVEVPTSTPPLTTVGLFAGIGGIELGLHASGHRTVMLNEIWPPAQTVLRERFPDIVITSDVRELQALPDADLVAAGFPCTDLSQAGRTRGIGGPQSGLVENLFRLIDHDSEHPKWVLIENVPFLLQLERGDGMRYLVDRLEDLRFRWAYRVVDVRAFGLPQRRRRVLMLASRTEDPRPVLFGEDAGIPNDPTDPKAFGFFWTEGLRGLGWAVEALPTLKGGSTIGIPSPPAIWFRDSGDFVTPDLRDAERLQGFDVDWTEPVHRYHKRAVGIRWKLVGNAVAVPMARWLGAQLVSPKTYGGPFVEQSTDAKWPTAAWGEAGRRFGVPVSEWPTHARYQPLSAFLQYPTKPLSLRAISGFRSRTDRSGLRFPAGFLEAVRSYERRMASAGERAA